jgi:hypothetical protein
MVISVIGEGGDSPSPEAQRNVTVVCDDLDGVMKAEGGVTMGILPGDDPDDANPSVDYPIYTGMGYARNTIVAKALESTTQTKAGAK